MNNKGTYIYKDMDVSNVFLNASRTLYDAVAHTIGPNGLNSAIPTSNGYLSIINDGKTILESLSSDNPAIKLALNTLKESAFATNQNAGDGTTSTIILQHTLLENVICNNLDPERTTDPILTKDLNYALKYLLEKLPELKKDISSKEDLLNVIKVSLGSDELSNVVLEAFDNIQKDQKPSLIKTTSTDKTEVISIDGVSLAPVEINPVALRTFTASSDEPLNIVILKQQVSRIDKPFATILNRMASSNNKTVLLYTELMPSVLDQILFNIQEGSLNVIPVRLAYPLDKLDDYVEELSKYFKVQVMDDLHPYQTDFNKPEIMGTATGYIINKDSIILKADNEEYQSTLLPSKSTAISVGFVTYSKQDETFRRLEDAIYSAYNAINYGYVLGAGFTYYTLGTMLDELKEINTKPIKDALQFMYNQFLLQIPLEKHMEYTNYIETNIFDSYKVAEQVILNAFTVVSQVLSTECILVPYENKRP